MTFHINLLYLRSDFSKEAGVEIAHNAAMNEVLWQIPPLPTSPQHHPPKEGRQMPRGYQREASSHIF